MIKNGTDNPSFERTAGRSLTLFGLGFAFLEVVKQIYLIKEVFHGVYDVWYVPFQLCSMPIYLCLICGIIMLRSKAAAGDSAVLNSGLQTVILTFLMDYGFLGGVMALIVRDGFTFPDHPLLTVHGWVWHIGMVLLSIWIFSGKLGDLSAKGYLRTIPLFLGLAAVAEIINAVLRGKGDCDMFYISPYHLSSQPVFADIDASAGRPLGIVIYLFAVCFGAFLSHLIFGMISVGAKK